MQPISRRQFERLALAAAGSPALNSVLRGASVPKPAVDSILRAIVQEHKIPCVTAVVAGPDTISYSGAFGKRDSASAIDVTPDSLFAIASMTKAVTSTAAMQLVERGSLNLEEPVAKHLPELGNLQVLTGFDAAGKPQLRPANKPVTLHHLLTHTSGFVYDTWDANMLRYEGTNPASPNGKPSVTPLMFDPGSRWQYGTGLDWTGLLVETVSGLTLEQYFQRNIFQPLGMKDTSFIVAPEKFERLVSIYRRDNSGALKENPRTPPSAPKFFNGGGGLYSTANDYTRFTQMILRRGAVTGRERILRAKTVEMMASNQIGPLSAGKLKTVRPEISADVDFHPGFQDKFGYGFLINTSAYQHGRSAGSLAWAGVYNTFYWIDPRRNLSAVIMMHFLPFCDPEAVASLRDFERAVYAGRANAS